MRDLNARERNAVENLRAARLDAVTLPGSCPGQEASAGRAVSSWTKPVRSGGAW